METKNKVAIVTGASSGIGLATAKLLSQKGAKVILVARSKEKLEQLSKTIKDTIAIPTDVQNENDIANMVQKTLEQIGRIDILVNNAGRGYHVPIVQIETDKYRELFNLDVVAPLVAMQKVIPVMKKQGSGTIINISSGTSLMYGPGLGAYSSVKRALNAISLTAREELKKDNIIVSVVYPYITKTQFHQNLLNEGIWNMQQNEHMPPFDTPEYVAEKILEAIETGKAEIFAHDWMNPQKNNV